MVINDINYFIIRLKNDSIHFETFMNKFNKKKFGLLVDKRICQLKDSIFTSIIDSKIHKEENLFIDTDGIGIILTE